VQTAASCPFSDGRDLAVTVLAEFTDLRDVDAAVGAHNRGLRHGQSLDGPQFGGGIRLTARRDQQQRADD
jgi:hypothetical protein